MGQINCRQWQRLPWLKTTSCWSLTTALEIAGHATILGAGGFFLLQGGIFSVGQWVSRPDILGFSHIFLDLSGRQFKDEDSSV